MTHNDYSTIFETPRGCVVRCECCGRLHVLFGNALLHVDRGGFERLRDAIAVLDSAEAVASSPLGRRLLLSAADTGISFAFTPAEIGEFRTLLEGTALLLELRAGG